jgi:hypothetical protein
VSDVLVDELSGEAGEVGEVAGGDGEGRAAAGDRFWMATIVIYCLD